ncbi:hypothetical protein DW241_10015 [Hungatella hathewayi]|nr:hypothetical protein DW241_10015 [Hungatella hathewayi]
MDFDAIKQSLASYGGHLRHGHTWKLQAHIYGRFVLTKAPKNGTGNVVGENPETDEKICEEERNNP